ncbi:MAG: S1 RNA-binding domain-containing protein [Planctomycetes bacterium]|nr:S1 RNA-binding domain-containing protein [Planctomycetota bacterium]
MSNPPIEPSQPPATQSAASSRVDDLLEQEMAQALAGLSESDLLGISSEKKSLPKVKGDGHTRTGTIIRVQGGDVMVEFGPKSQGVCPLSQFETPPEAGTVMDFSVERLDAFEGLLILSRIGMRAKPQWDNLQVGQIVDARCVGMNQGGLDMEVAHHRAFMPAGQVDLRTVPDISIFLGEKLQCMIIELRKERGRMVLSRKAALSVTRRKEQQKTLEEIEPGQIREATISSLQPFGAFADIGGVDGLIHISDLAHERLKNASDAVKVGDVVRVKVMRVDRAQKPPRISLSRKEVMDDPVVGKFETLQAGETVSGRVTKLAEFGAFVELSPGVEGLVHISEISHDRIFSADKVLKVDQVVTAKILSIDAPRRRVSLSIKALLDRPAPAPGAHQDRQPAKPTREDDPAMRKLRLKFGSTSALKGGLS